MKQLASQTLRHDLPAPPVPVPTRCKEGKGVRNFDCIYYEACLDKAAKGMWSGFTCAKCAYYS